MIGSPFHKFGIKLPSLSASPSSPRFDGTALSCPSVVNEIVPGLGVVEARHDVAGADYLLAVPHPLAIGEVEGGIGVASKHFVVLHPVQGREEGEAGVAGELKLGGDLEWPLIKLLG